MKQKYYELGENRGKNNLPPKKFDFNKYKTNSIHSLNEIEYFLRNFKTASKYIKIYKLFK